MYQKFFLNIVNFIEFSNHYLQMKEEMPITLLRNINPTSYCAMEQNYLLYRANHLLNLNYKLLKQRK